jgi:hypothetical protein
LVERRACAVPGQPGCFAVGRVTAAAVMLFLASVDDRDSISEEDEGEDILRLRIVARVARRSVRGEKTLDSGMTYDANRGLSWFSMKFPSNVGSAQSEATELIMLYRLVMLPLVDSNAYSNW